MAVFFFTGYDGLKTYSNQFLSSICNMSANLVPILVIWIFFQAAINFNLTSNTNVRHNKNGIDPCER